MLANSRSILPISTDLPVKITLRGTLFEHSTSAIWPWPTLTSVDPFCLRYIVFLAPVPTVASF